MNIAFGLTKRALGCSGVVLDTIYEVTGRRVEALRLGAEMLYDLSRLGQPAKRDDVADAQAHEASEQPIEAAPTADAAAADEGVAASETNAHLNGAAHPEMEEAALAAAPQEEAPAEEVEAASAEEAVAEEVATAFPIEDYDSLNVRKVERALDDLNEVELQAVMAYEQANKGRKTVVRALERRLGSM